MGWLLVAALAGLVVWLGPPKADDTVIVVPSADGHVGTVVVERNGGREVLHEAYAASRSDKSGLVHLSAQEVRQSFGPVLAALPDRPASFRLYFVSGTDELTEESRAKLHGVLQELRRRPVPDIVVVGHTDTVGELLANDQLSAQRAERVKQFLIDIGIAAERVKVAGRGERELLIPTADNVDEPRNRRVEISVR
ncbi:MAG TPA: OmpA family protein [Burkholderiales bacterium]|nr:OmpA family protein [Burkholderiales bacterium]